MKTFAVLAASLLSLSAYGADPKAGAAAFEKSCKGCHGASGAGNPAMAKAFPNLPDLTSATVQAESDDALAKVIKEGKGKMPASKTLTSSPDDVVAFLRTLKK